MVFHQVLRFNLISISAPSTEICFFWFYIGNLYQFPAIKTNSHITLIDSGPIIVRINHLAIPKSCKQAIPCN
ncbi:unnamed protein product [Rhizophagus irregularis]|nr:unnamed protein product [Rhizophagus irregularis]